MQNKSRYFITQQIIHCVPNICKDEKRIAEVVMKMRCGMCLYVQCIWHCLIDILGKNNKSFSETNIKHSFDGRISISFKRLICFALKLLGIDESHRAFCVINANYKSREMKYTIEFFFRSNEWMYPSYPFHEKLLKILANTHLTQKLMYKTINSKSLNAVYTIHVCWFNWCACFSYKCFHWECFRAEFLYYIRRGEVE